MLKIKIQMTNNRKIMERKTTIYTILSIFLISIFSGGLLQAQNTMPEIMEKGTLEEQKEYLEERTNIYNGFRAIRDDIFLQMLKNSLDSLNSVKHEIDVLLKSEHNLQLNIESLNSDLIKSQSTREKAIKDKNTLLFFGLTMNKITYNLILWGVIVGLTFLLVVVFLFYKTNYSITSNTRKDLEDTRKEFDAFRKISREKQEQMVINHFNEIKKLKGGV